MKWEDAENKIPVTEKKKCGEWELDIEDKDFYTQFYLHHHGLLISPYGIGESLKGAMEDFLDKVAEYRKVLDECEKYIKKELENENSSEI